MIETKLEKEFGWNKLNDFNILIGKFIGAKPDISYRIADKDGNYCIEFDEKPENFAKHWADVWFRNNKQRDGMDKYSVQRYEQFPYYDRDWNELIKVVQFLKNAGKTIDFQPEIEITYKSILSVCGCL